ncbi:Kp4-domain-containing protein [Cercophora scortea]|uniref:Kp4-domain-containing protein n=1 Tax=Cercophora scortea TaxID=314031 RepID=A0AAE0IUT9_9PEZI|nr:Kp4-domain-containing protein [Cercophora scortea]
MKLTAILSLASFSGALALPADQSENPATLAARALGINCRGSALCSDARSGSNAASRLQGYINNIQGNRVYHNGEHIACVARGSLISPNGGFCAFLQYTNRDVNGAAIKNLIAAIVGHNCKVCGSVPIDFPGSNDPKNGILTVNYVANTDNPCPDGLC